MKDETMKDETFVVMGRGSWGKGATLDLAIQALQIAEGRPLSTRDGYDVKRIYWRTEDARENARSFDKDRKANGLPSWVSADGSPFVDVNSLGDMHRPVGTTLEVVIANGRWNGRTIESRK